MSSEATLALSTHVQPENRPPFDSQKHPYVSQGLIVRKFTEIKDARTLQMARILYAKALAEFSVEHRTRSRSSFSRIQPAESSFCSIAKFVRGILKTSNS